MKPREYKYSKCFSSSLENVNLVVEEIMIIIRLAFKNIDNQQKREIHLILCELLYNCVIHGNKYNKNKMVYINMQIINQIINCRIKDEGAGFDYTKSISQFYKENNLYCENGRGVLIAYELSDTFTYNAKSNEINFSKKVTNNG